MQLTTVTPEVRKYLRTIDNTNTRDAYKRNVDQFAEYLVETWDVRTLNTVKLEVFQAYKEWLLDHYSSATVNSKLASVKKFFDFLFERQVVNHCEHRLVKSISVDSNDQVTPCHSQEELAVIFSSISTQAASSTMESIIMLLMANTGLRREELVKLKHRNIQGMPVLVQIKGAKGNKSRDIELSLDVSKKLNELLTTLSRQKGVEFNGNDYVVQSTSNRTKGKRQLKPVTLSAINVRLAKLGERAGIESLTPHSLRRTFATMLYHNGATIDDISIILGHKDTATTRKYLGKEIERFISSRNTLNVGVI